MPTAHASFSKTLGPYSLSAKASDPVKCRVSASIGKFQIEATVVHLRRLYYTPSQASYLRSLVGRKARGAFTNGY